MRTLYEYLKLIVLTLKTIFKLKSQQKFIEKNLLPVLEKHEVDSGFSKYDLYKIVHYYSLGVVVMLGDYFCILRGEQLSEKERKSLTYMAAISTMYDDLFDKTNHDKQVIEKMTYEPESFKPSNIKETIFNDLTLKAIETIGLRSLLDSTRKELFEIQWLTKKQNIKGEFSWGELKDNTMNKGGWSFLFYRSALGNEISGEEKEIVFQIGGLLQYSNDIFDVYKDSEDGIYTQANSVEDINLVYKDFKREMYKTFTMIKESTYSNKICDELLDSLYLLCARNIVCLNQYLKVQKSHGGVFKVKELPRAELICDMENVSNLLRMARSYVTLAKMGN